MLILIKIWLYFGNLSKYLFEEQNFHFHLNATAPHPAKILLVTILEILKRINSIIKPLKFEVLN